MNIDKVCNAQAEIEVLGAILLDNNSFSEIFAALEPENFYVTKHKLIYSAMKDMYRKNMPIEPIALYEFLGTGKAKEIGGLTYLTELSNTSCSSKNIKHYANIIKEKSINKQLISKLSQAVNTLENTDSNFQDTLDFIRKDIFSLSMTSSNQDSHISNCLLKYMDNLEERFNRGGDITGLSTGYPSIDRITGGFNSQDLIILAGRPSMGKSAVALNLALSFAEKTKGHTAIFSLEMSNSQCLSRLISKETSIPMKKLKVGNLSDEDWNKVMESSNKLNSLNLSLYDDVITLDNIISECKKLKIQKGLDLVVIDYMQNIVASKNKDNRSQELSTISRTLKLLAKELDITILALSQLSRAPETRNDHRPILSDLRESGSLEQDADIVMFVYRDAYYNKDTENANVIEIIVSKNRNGEVGTLKMKWDGAFQKLYS